MNDIYTMSNIELTQKRTIRFPFPLMRVGEVSTPDYDDLTIRDHEHLEFCIRLSSGEAEAIDELDGKIYKYGFPHLFIKKPGVLHHYTIKSQRRAFFFIYSSEVISLFETCGMDLTSPGIEFNLTPKLQDLLDELTSMLPDSQKYGMAEKFDLIAFQILENIYLQSPVSSGENRENDNSIREIASYLQMNFTKKIDFNELCHKFGISRRSFFRHWAKHYDRTPLQYVMDLKISEAERLLSSNYFQVQEISSRLGFDNSAYFIRAFRRYHDGMTPGEFRKILKQKMTSQ